MVAERTYKRDRVGRFAHRQYRLRPGKPVAGYPTVREKGHDVPYDPQTGTVPQQLLAARYTAEGDPSRDSRRRARHTVIGNPTPLQAADWWADPHGSDVEGIDTPDGELYELGGLRRPEAQRRIAVMAETPEDQAQIRQDLEEAFTPDELARMSARGLLIDATRTDSEHLGGTYLRTENRPGYTIEVSRDAVGDGRTAVHEAVHQLRQAEGRSQNRDRSGRTNTGTGPLDRGLEEHETEKETARRLSEPHSTGRENVIIDTNVIDQGIGRQSPIEAKAVKTVQQKDRHVYTETVDEELRKVHDKDPDVNRRILDFANRHQRHMVFTVPATEEELKRYPVIGNDRRIMDEAVKTDTSVIVTADKKFKKKGNGFEGFDVMLPQEYINSKNP